MIEGTNKSHLLAVTKILLSFTYKLVLELHFHCKCLIRNSSKKLSLCIASWHAPSNKHISALPHMTCKCVRGEERQNRNSNKAVHQKVDVNAVWVQGGHNDQVPACYLWREGVGGKQQHFLRLVPQETVHSHLRAPGSSRMPAQEGLNRHTRG